MNCREAEPLIFAARDGALDESRRAALAEHLEHCSACQVMQTELESAGVAWRTADTAATVPAVEVEWHAIRRRIRGAPPETNATGWRRPLWWSLATGMAAVAVAALFGPRWFQADPATASRDAGYVSYVVVYNTSDSTMVYEDAESGWLVVWVTNDSATSGT